MKDSPSNTAVGARFVYQEAVRRITDQMKIADALDNKSAAVIGFLGAVLIATALNINHPIFDELGSGKPWFIFSTLVLLTVAIVGGAGAFWIWRYKDAPNVTKLMEYRHYSDDRIADEFLGNLDEAFVHNENALRQKSALLFVSMLFGLLAFLEIVVFSGIAIFR